MVTIGYLDSMWGKVVVILLNTLPLTYIEDRVRIAGRRAEIQNGDIAFMKGDCNNCCYTYNTIEYVT
jgi:hypothetical protein